MSALLDTASAIGRRLCDEALWHGERCNWMGALAEVSEDGRVRTAWGALGTDLYAGTGGVGRFLAELWAVTGDRDVRRTALGALRQAASRLEDTPPHRRLGLYTGWTGLAVTFGRCAVLLDEEGLTEHARQIARRLAGDPPQAPGLDLLSGRAGAILGLMDLAGVLGDARQLARAEELARELIAAADPSEGGLSWRPPDARRWGNLTGLSHGAAGVALGLLELHASTGDDDALAAAEGAFEYEGRRYDPEERNWPDLRPRGPEGVTPAPSFPVAWCHGAAGIAVSRLRAWEITRNPDRRGEAAVALETTSRMVANRLRSGSDNFSLCHGLAGNAEVLVHGQDVLGSAAPGGRATALEVAGAAAEAHAAKRHPWPCGTPEGETPGLMLGLAGIGLFYLRLSEPAIPSILTPRPGRATASAR